ncbi:winged helix-turn-helix transcriptional regulator [Streptomyces sp. NPDC014995]|uniref:winged helix-turn-helix transcriptional regulator n=1 Tax=Streptomyces sp. NPDC014995 TaxID=3364936 RepID=UPI0036F8B26E
MRPWRGSISGVRGYPHPDSVEGVSRRVPTLTPRDLERDGLVTRTVHPAVPLRVEYELTPVAREVHATLQTPDRLGRAHRVSMAEARAAHEGEHAPEPVDAQAAQAPVRGRTGSDRMPAP